MNHKNKNWLEEEYIINKKSIYEMAKMCDVSPQGIYYQLKKFGIQTRTLSEAQKVCVFSEERKAKHAANLKKATDRKSREGVSEEERQRLKEIRKLRKNHAHSDLTKEKMRKSALGKKMSNEARQKMSEAKKELFSTPQNHPLYGVERKDMLGENNPNWAGGNSSLYRRIRKLKKYSEWRTFCFERDEYKCTKCNKKSNGDLHVDHIKPFAVTVTENNIQTTYQAQHCKELWDVNNGRTLCEVCHKSTSTWGIGTKRLLNNLSMRKD